ncbi:MAG: hypothetical protein ACTSYA_09925, partial [Candidatus Kariarchaeaceae archaeon]
MNNEIDFEFVSSPAGDSKMALKEWETDLDKDKRSCIIYDKITYAINNYPESTKYVLDLHKLSDYLADLEALIVKLR